MWKEAPKVKPFIVPDNLSAPRRQDFSSRDAFFEMLALKYAKTLLPSTKKLLLINLDLSDGGENNYALDVSTAA